MRTKRNRQRGARRNPSRLLDLANSFDQWARNTMRVLHIYVEADDECFCQEPGLPVEKRCSHCQTRHALAWGKRLGLEAR